MGRALADRLRACFTFLPHGRPLQLPVDYHGLGFTHDPAALTQLGWTRKLHDLRPSYAPAPPAKGKVEREHRFWQGRPPPHFASEQTTDLAPASRHRDGRRAHHNAHAIHRERRQTPHHAWAQARKEKRPAPRGPWGDFVWSVRTTLNIGTETVGRPIGTQRLRLQKPPGTKVVLGRHSDDHPAVLAAPPEAQ